jgi:hypothetical protein
MLILLVFQFQFNTNNLKQKKGPLKVPFILWIGQTRSAYRDLVVELLEARAYRDTIEQVPGIEPRSSDWKSEVMTVIRYLQI